MPSALFFFFRIAVAILGLLWFQIHFRIICSSSVKNVLGILIAIVLNLKIALCSMAILTILILLIQEHVVSFHSNFQFPLSMFYSFQHIGLSPPCLSLFLGFFF